MRKVVIISLLASLLLAACNLPTGQTKPGSTPPVNAVETQVGLLLTSQPSATNPPTQPATAVLPTLSAPSETPSPTATSNAPSATPAPSLTPASDDPKANLGQPAWKNTFDTGKGFGLQTPYEDDNTRLAVENGMLVMTGKQANGWHTWRLTSPKIQDFYLEATTHTLDCSSNDIYGLVVRAPDFDSGRGYYFGITCDGRYNFGKWVEQGIVDIVSLTKSSDILAGSNQTNRLGVMAKGSKITLYANGKAMKEIDDDTFPSAGNFGLWLAANKTAGFTVQLDEIAYWNLR